MLAHVEERVGGVGSNSLLIDVIGRCLFNLAEKVLLDVELAHVGDGATRDSVVGQKLCSVVDDG